MRKAWANLRLRGTKRFVLYVVVTFGIVVAGMTWFLRSPAPDAVAGAPADADIDMPATETTPATFDVPSVVPPDSEVARITSGAEAERAQRARDTGETHIPALRGGEEFPELEDVAARARLRSVPTSPDPTAAPARTGLSDVTGRARAPVPAQPSPTGAQSWSPWVLAEVEALAQTKTEANQQLTELLSGPGRETRMAVTYYDPVVTASPPETSVLPSRPILSVAPGDVFLANIQTDVNSDFFAPVITTIVDPGPLEGARLVGIPSLLGDARITLAYTSMHLDGVDHAIDAVGVDPWTLQPAMASEVDHHRVQRYVAPFLAAFARGYADALRGSTTVAIGGVTQTFDSQIPEASDQAKYALGQAGGELLPRLTQNMRRPTVRLSPRDGVGVMFVSPFDLPPRLAAE